MPSRNIEILHKLIEQKTIKVVSFDIFNTLIFRPAINPHDIFYFLNSYYRKNSNKAIIKNLSKYRRDSECELIREIGIENVTIDLIYERLQRKVNLGDNIKNDLKHREISLDVELSDLNKEINNILERAKKNGKKIILTSDIYLPSKYIIFILNKFNIIYDELYISSDIKKRKDKGDLYDEIIYREKVLSSEILHIGDNENSDYIIPLNKGILAFHYIPHNLKTKKKLCGELNSKTQEITSIFLGFLINEENSLSSKENMKYTNMYDFGYYSIGPFLLAIMLNLLFSNKIQNVYNALFFPSGDGYLPFKIYEILRKNAGSGIPGKYIYCGCRALNIAYYNDNVLEYLSNIYEKVSQLNTIYTIKDLFISLNIEKYYVEVNNHVNKDLNICNFISDINELTKELQKRKNDAKQYFQKIFDDEGKGIIFDCGYSGSVSDSIYHLLYKRINKICLWELEQNKIMDTLNKTNTYLIFNNYDEIQPFNLLFEELFSPLEPACIGYEMKGFEIFSVFDNNEKFSDKMKEDLTNIHSGVFDYVNKFCIYFKELLPYFSIVDYQSVLKYTMEHLFNEEDKTINLLCNIVFNDKYHDGNTTDSLLNKLCLKNRKNSFKGNILINSDALYLYKFMELPDNMNIKLGIHIHLFYIDLYIDFLEILKEFPYPFDLFITITDKACEKIIYVCFSNEIIPNLKKINVIFVQNRGRDVAPWLIEMKSIHEDYDIFGHFHTKKNIGIGFRDEWRNYLLDNLMSKDTVIDILNLFNNFKNLGIVFPPLYKDVYSFFKREGGPPFQEHITVRDYLLRIGLPEITNCNEVLFCAGTMFWYRPIALNKLFYAGLSYNDFPMEPIGFNGTLAHAIERLPSYAAANAGYETKLYLNPKILAKSFYNQYIKQEEITIPVNPILIFSLKQFCKKIYFIILGIIPSHHLRETIDYQIRKRLYTFIKKNL